MLRSSVDSNPQQAVPPLTRTRSKLKGIPPRSFSIPEGGMPINTRGREATRPVGLGNQRWTVQEQLRRSPPVARKKVKDSISKHRAGQAVEAAAASAMKDLTTVPDKSPASPRPQASFLRRRSVRLAFSVSKPLADQSPKSLPKYLKRKDAVRGNLRKYAGTLLNKPRGDLDPDQRSRRSERLLQLVRAGDILKKIVVRRGPGRSTAV